MKVFEAQFRGRCAACDETIHPGDKVGYEDDLLVHGRCAGDGPIDITRKPSQTRDSVCPICSLDHAGECY